MLYPVELQTLNRNLGLRFPICEQNRRGRQF
jgi:hypothetical protein